MVTPIERDDACVVHHFVQEHHVVNGLKDLHIHVVGSR